MRNVKMVAAIVGLISVSVLANPKQYAIVRENGASVYAQEIRKMYEKPLFYVSAQERLPVQESSKGMVKIRNKDGKTGWMEESAVQLLSTNKSFQFDSAKVTGYIDVFTPGIVVGTREFLEMGMQIDRSFADELRENVDRETVTRQSGETQ